MSIIRTNLNLFSNSVSGAQLVAVEYNWKPKNHILSLISYIFSTLTSTANSAQAAVAVEIVYYY